MPDSSIKEGLNTVQWPGRNQLLQKNPQVIFDVAHNTESLRCFLDYYKSLGVSGKSTLVLAINRRKRIKNIVPLLELSFQHIICTETIGRDPMSADILCAHFNSQHSIEIIKNSSIAIRKGLNSLSPNDGMAILGTHCLGPTVKEQFKISFDNI